MLYLSSPYRKKQKIVVLFFMLCFERCERFLPLYHDDERLSAPYRRTCKSTTTAMLKNKLERI
eukprot:scaffold1090_cov244-Chaetoceros_neogracile.AAC.4